MTSKHKSADLSIDTPSGSRAAVARLGKMKDCQSTQLFSIPVGESQKVDIYIAEPDLRAQGLSLTTWTSSLVLAKLMHGLDVELSPSQSDLVLELGAGTGLVGLTAAMLWKARIILSDLQPIVAGLEGNIGLNFKTLKDGQGQVESGALDWSEPDILTLWSGEQLRAERDKAKVILAADTVYSEEHPQLLSHAILAWLAPGTQSRVVLTYALRVAYLDQVRELWEMLEAGGLEAVAHAQEQESSHEWDDECLCEWSVWRWKESVR